MIELNKTDVAELKEKAAEIRRTFINMIHAAGSGHAGGSLSATDILTLLYYRRLNVNPDMPDDPDRDRLVLS